MLLDIPEAQTQLFTNASESGWGAHLDTFQASGEWSAREAILHVNQLEMLAVRYRERRCRRVIGSSGIIIDIYLDLRD